MKILEYCSADGTRTMFGDYTIDENGVIRNVVTGWLMTQCRNASGYNVTTLSHNGRRRAITVARALASTFLGSPPTIQHTVDHIDQNRSNDTLSNVRWLCKSGQGKNRAIPSDYNTAFVIVKDGIEHTAKEWVGIFKKSDGTCYSTRHIQEFAQRQKHGFGYKVFPKLCAEVWKAVPNSKSKKGEWFISTKNRMKYKTAYAENVLTAEQLSKWGSYPGVGINGKWLKCHYVSMMTFRPREYAAKLPGDVLCHKNDDKLDFNPFRLRWGTRQENATEAHDNGKHNGTNSARKPVGSYVGGELERVHESLGAATRYLRENGYPKAQHGNVIIVLNTNIKRYGRTWSSTL
ncbi:hypothetical protein ATCVGM07011_309R [Acanthocystis turfacea Chlorella virus GM0701.1]|nr:hypothetical protein ATCVGM07011_309R [Acanthocystis turfacea Chlorella virus GM0701.1]